jgi:hypothetical protein
MTLPNSAFYSLDDEMMSGGGGGNRGCLSETRFNNMMVELGDDGFWSNEESTGNFNENERQLYY